MRTFGFVALIVALIALFVSPAVAQVGNSKTYVPQSTWTGARWADYTGSNYEASAVRVTKTFATFDCDSMYFAFYGNDTAKVSRITIFHTPKDNLYIYTDSTSFAAGDTVQSVAAIYKQMSLRVKAPKGPYSFAKIYFADSGNPTGANVVNSLYYLVLQKYRNW